MQVAIASPTATANKMVADLQKVGLHAQDFASLSDVSELTMSFAVDLVLVDGAVAGAVEKAVRTFRSSRRNVPVMAFCARPDRAFSLTCFSAGADDVVAWPGDMEIIAARIRSVVRRCRGAETGAFRIGPLSFDMIRRSLLIDNRPLSLTSKEYDLLEYMVTRKNTILTKDVLLNQLYGARDAPDSRIIDVFVCKLRKKFALAGVHGLIETVRGAGYRLSEHGCRFAVQSAMKRLSAMPSVAA
ncbi:response regulator transcription factor [Acetobacteraceae bacterium KSS8]|uniref:Response regulator transcription factor n=1 Tax=Endosaccharibacter trunci TaxID=2812733 RepID=A0ABT1W7E7_9PROT|nr:response regulator transcription factor [Acetobacteraceae bacterium KSS8]